MTRPISKLLAAIGALRAGQLTFVSVPPLRWISGAITRWSWRRLRITQRAAAKAPIPDGAHSYPDLYDNQPTRRLHGRQRAAISIRDSRLLTSCCYGGVGSGLFHRTIRDGAIDWIILAIGRSRSSSPSMAMIVIVGLKKPKEGWPLDTSRRGRARTCA